MLFKKFFVQVALNITLYNQPVLGCKIRVCHLLKVELVVLKEWSEVIHKLRPHVVGSLVLLLSDMEPCIDQFLHYSDVRMIEVIAHRHHRCEWKTPAEAPSAYLSIKPGE